MMRETSLKGCGTSEIVVMAQQILQMCCSTAPMAKYEKRRIVNSLPTDPPTVEDGLGGSEY
jgi:hypothetical protein